MTNTNCLKEIDLTNGYKLKVIDKSRKIGLKDWVIIIEFSIKIPINESMFKELSSAPDIKDILRKTGNETEFVVESKRNFINEKDKQSTIDSLIHSYLDTNLKYLSHPLFAAKYVLKEYAA